MEKLRNLVGSDVMGIILMYVDQLTIHEKKQKSLDIIKESIEIPAWAEDFEGMITHISGLYEWRNYFCMQCGELLLISQYTRRYGRPYKKRYRGRLYKHRYISHRRCVNCRRQEIINEPEATLNNLNHKVKPFWDSKIKTFVII